MQSCKKVQNDHYPVQTCQKFMSLCFFYVVCFWRYSRLSVLLLSETIYDVITFLICIIQIRKYISKWKTLFFSTLKSPSNKEVIICRLKEGDFRI